MAAAHALADAQRLAMPRNGDLATNLVLAAENVADHFTHFYLFFMPDFARAYARTLVRPPGAALHRHRRRRACARRSAPAPMAAPDGAAGRQGRTPLGLQPGGSTRPILAQECLRLLLQIAGFRRFRTGDFR